LTDNLTDARGVPLWSAPRLRPCCSPAVFSIWYARERTCDPLPVTRREAWYCDRPVTSPSHAVGDWTLELTGWSRGQRSWLRVSLNLAVLVAWRLGAGPVLCFWLA